MENHFIATDNQDPITIEYLTETGYITKSLEDSSDDSCDIVLTWETLPAETQPEIEAKLEKIKIKIASISNWPEFKTEMVTRCTPPPVRICTDVPKGYTRNCNKTVYAIAAFPEDLESSVKRAIKDCANKAAVVAVAAALSGGAAAALPVFAASFELCIKINAAEYASKIRYRVDDETSCGRWTPR